MCSGLYSCKCTYGLLRKLLRLVPCFISCYIIMMMMVTIMSLQIDFLHSSITVSLALSMKCSLLKVYLSLFPEVRVFSVAYKAWSVSCMRHLTCSPQQLVPWSMWWVTAGQVKGYTVSGLQQGDCHLPCLCSDATPVIPSGSAELAAGWVLRAPSEGSSVHFEGLVSLQ